MDTTPDVPRDFETLKALLLAQHARLPKRLKQAANYAITHPDEVALGTVAEVATGAGVQPSTLVRLAQTIGYGGYSDMQQVFRGHLKERWPDYSQRLEDLKSRGAGTPAEAHALAHLSGFADAAGASIARLRATLDPVQLDRMVSVLAGADTIHLVGARRVFPITIYLSYAFAKMGVRCHLVDHIGQMGAEQLACARAGDAVLALSFTPYTQSTIDLAARSARAGVPVVAITDSAFSPLVASASAWLEVAEADYGSFRSLAGTMVLAMAIAVSVAERRTAAG